MNISKYIAQKMMRQAANTLTRAERGPMAFAEERVSKGGDKEARDGVLGSRVARVL
jgi:hypothetical protein